MSYTNINRTRTIDHLEIALESLKHLHILMRESDGKNEAMRAEWEQLLVWISQL